MYRGKGFHRPASKDSGVEPFKRVHHEIQRSQKASTSSSTSQSESPPLGALIKIITRDYLISHESRLDPKAAKIDDAEYAASYSWTNRASPTIFVPGKVNHIAAMEQGLPLSLRFRKASIVDSSEAKTAP
jgi:hypothetical protein